MLTGEMQNQPANQNSEPIRAEMRALWVAEPVAPAPLFAELYDFIVERSEKRMPRWRFRLAEDLIFQVHPQLIRQGRCFKWLALETDKASAELLKQSRYESGRVYVRLWGKLVDSGGESWKMEVRAADQSHPHCGAGAYHGLRKRILETFRCGRFNQFNPEIMFRTNCLCCGKGLTDPVSMARFIGSECWQHIHGRFLWTADCRS